MPEGFVSLGDFFRATLAVAKATRSGDPDGASDDNAREPKPEMQFQSAAFDEAVSQARRFRAALADALDLAVESLLKEIARDVIGRELEINGADVAAIVANARDRFVASDVVAVRVCSADIGATQALGFAVIPDDTLSRGDVSIELHSGTIEMSLATRLAAVVAACTA